MDALRAFVDDNLSCETAAQIYANRVPGLSFTGAAAAN
jgi:hypothetical protein